MLFCWGFRTCSPFKPRTLFSPLTVLISSSELLSIQQARERIALHPLLGNRKDGCFLWNVSLHPGEWMWSSHELTYSRGSQFPHSDSLGKCWPVEENSSLLPSSDPDAYRNTSFGLFTGRKVPWWTAVMCLWLPPALLRDVRQDCDALIIRVPPSRLTCPSFKWCRVVQPHFAPPLAALQKVGISQLLCLCPRWIL